MEIVAREMPADYEIYDTGDWHCGAANSNLQGIKQMIGEIESAPDKYLILKGDLIDAIETSDKRFSLTSFDKATVTTPHEQAINVLQILQPVKDRILFCLLGNHEYRLLPTFSPLDLWCDSLGIPWGGINAKFIHLHNGKPQWKGFYMHGRKQFNSHAKDPIQKRANREAALKNTLKDLAGDCIYMSCGHAHALICVQATLGDQLYLYDDGKNIRQRYRAEINQAASYIDAEARYYCCSGSFLSTMSRPGQRLISYSEVAGYAPQEHGYIRQTVRDHKLVAVERVVI